MGATYPTLAISHVLSPLEIRVLWLSLYAGALSRAMSTDDAIAFAHRGCIELSAAIVEGVDALPPWLREREEEHEDEWSPHDAAARAALPAMTKRLIRGEGIPVAADLAAALSERDDEGGA